MIKKLKNVFDSDGKPQYRTAGGMRITEDSARLLNAMWPKKRRVYVAARSRSSK